MDLRKWIDDNFWDFLKELGIHKSMFEKYERIIYSKIDLANHYKETFRRDEIPFYHGVCLFLLTYIPPWSAESGDIGDGIYIKVEDWIKSNYDFFKDKLPESPSEGKVAQVTFDIFVENEKDLEEIIKKLSNFNGIVGGPMVDNWWEKEEYEKIGGINL
jgi:hypothetical protein